MVSQWHTPAIKGDQTFRIMRKWADLKALSTGHPDEGGYLVADQALAEILTAERGMNVMREIGRVLPPVPAGAALAVPAVEEFMSDAEWTTELSFGAEDSSLSYGQRRLTPHAIAKYVKASKDFARNPGVNIEEHVKEMLSRAVSNPQERAFISGDGAGEPLGLLNSPSLPTYITATQALAYGNDLVSWIYALPAKYRKRASIVTSSDFVRKLRALSKPDTATAFDNYLAAPAFTPASAGSPARLEGVPLYESDEWPSIVDESDALVAGKIVAAIGDFSYYWIQDSDDLRFNKLVELLAETNRDIWTVRQETDAMAVLPEAFLALQLKA